MIIIRTLAPHSATITLSLPEYYEFFSPKIILDLCMHSPSKKREIGLLVQACRWVGLQPYWPGGCRMCRVPQARSSSRPMPMPAAELLLGLPSHAANVILTSQQLQPSGPRLPPQRATDPPREGVSQDDKWRPFLRLVKKALQREQLSLFRLQKFVNAFT